jgi:adhesin transport system outer membrane protein
MKLLKSAVLSLPVIAFLSMANATSLHDVVDHTLKNNHEIDSKKINDEAYRENIKQEKGGYYPKVDLTGTLGKVKVETDYKDSTITDTDSTSTGHNIQLDAEQLIYDGGYTPGKINEAKAKYSNNNYRNLSEIQDVLLDSLDSYLDMLKYSDRVKMTQTHLDKHKEYYQIATESAAISGEKLDQVQAKAKLHQIKKDLLEEENNLLAAKSGYERNVDLKLIDQICTPKLDESLIPTSLQELKDLATTSNFRILQQEAMIKEQKAILDQSDAAYLPTLKLKLQAIKDSDLITPDTDTDRYSGKIELKYNLFNGKSDESKISKQKLYLKEEKAMLQVRIKDVLDESTVKYNTYQMLKKQIVELQGLVKENKTIIEIYKDQFNSGNRDFIELLNVEADLYNARIELLDVRHLLFQTYYDLLALTANLESALTNTDKQRCFYEKEDDKFLFDGTSAPKQETTNELSSLLSEESKVNESVSALLEQNSEPTMAQSSSIGLPHVKKLGLQNDEYGMYICSCFDEANMKDEIAKVQKYLNGKAELVIIENNNGSKTLGLKNLFTKDEVLELKSKLAPEFPDAYLPK